MATGAAAPSPPSSPSPGDRRGTTPEASFYIPATGPATRPRRTLKCGDTFVVLDSYGDIGASAGGTDGLFHADTRFISHLELLLNGVQPLLLGSNVRDDNTSLTVDLTNPDMYYEDRLKGGGFARVVLAGGGESRTQGDADQVRRSLQDRLGTMSAKIDTVDVLSSVTFAAYRHRFLFVYVITGIFSLCWEFVVYRGLERLGLAYPYCAFAGVVSGILVAYWGNVRFNFKVPVAKRQRALSYFIVISFF